MEEPTKIKNSKKKTKSITPKKKRRRQEEEIIERMGKKVLANSEVDEGMNAKKSKLIIELNKLKDIVKEKMKNGI